MSRKRRERGAFAMLDFKPEKRSKRRKRPWWDTVNKKKRRGQKQRGLARFLGSDKKNKRDPFEKYFSTPKRARKSGGIDGSFTRALSERLTPNERMEMDAEVDRAMENDVYLNWAKHSASLVGDEKSNVVQRLVMFVRQRLKFG